MTSDRLVTVHWGANEGAAPTQHRGVARCHRSRRSSPARLGGCCRSRTCTAHRSRRPGRPRLQTVRDAIGPSDLLRKRPPTSVCDRHFGSSVVMSEPSLGQCIDRAVVVGQGCSLRVSEFRRGGPDDRCGGSSCGDAGLWRAGVSVVGGVVAAELRPLSTRSSGTFGVRLRSVATQQRTRSRACASSGAG